MSENGKCRIATGIINPEFQLKRSSKDVEFKIRLYLVDLHGYKLNECTERTYHQSFKSSCYGRHNELHSNVVILMFLIAKSSGR